MIERAHLSGRTDASFEQYVSFGNPLRTTLCRLRAIRALYRSRTVELDTIGAVKRAQQLRGTHRRRWLQKLGSSRTIALKESGNSCTLTLRFSHRNRRQPADGLYWCQNRGREAPAIEAGVLGMRPHSGAVPLISRAPNPIPGSPDPGLGAISESLRRRTHHPASWW